MGLLVSREGVRDTGDDDKLCMYNIVLLEMCPGRYVPLDEIRVVTKQIRGDIL